MKKILLTILVCTSLILIGVNSAFAIDIKKELNDKQDEIIKDFKPTDENKTYYTFITFGPARFVSKIDFIGGNTLQILRMKSLLKRIIFRPKTSLAFPIKLTFKITYTTEQDDDSRFSYGTAFLPFNQSGPAGNMTTIFNEPHSYTVKNFTGIVQFTRAKIINFRPLKLFLPAKFIFYGVCDELVEHTT
jgi:hypothetical protein